MSTIRRWRFRSAWARIISSHATKASRAYGHGAGAPSSRCRRYSGHGDGGRGGREAAIKMIVRRSPGSRRLTLGADKGYDTKTFVADLRDLNIAPHVAQNTTRRLFAL